MQYIDYIEINGVRGDIPVNQSGKGAPTTSTEGAVAQIYMDENTGDLYKCTQATKTVFTWVKIEAGSGGTVTVDSALSSTSENPVQNKVVKAALDGKQAKGNYLTAETDPTVPAWAKAAQKPTYTASEVGALPADTAIPDAYTLPVATASKLGGVKPVAKTSDMTQNVGVDANGKLYTAPSASQGSYELPTASSSVLGGVKADSAQSTDTQAVRIGTDGKLYTAPGSGGSSGDSPVKLIANNDSTNKKPLRSIDSGTYVLSGYFTSYEGGTESFTFNSGMVVAILKESSKSYVQVFYPKSNVIQYLEITDSAVTRKDAKLVNMESVANRVSAITSSSDTSHYPSAKAVYDAIQASGVPQTGSTAPEATTKGVVGQPYFVIVDNAVTEMYVCTSALIGSYTWDKVEFGGGTSNAVQYTEQSLTDTQKQQARTNIGAGTSSFSGSYNDLTNTPVLDTTLEQSGKPADAKAVGDAIGSAIETTTTILGASKVDKSQGTENAGKILGIGASGIVTPVDKPVYTLPIATPTVLGGVKPMAKTTAMTQDVGVSDDGKLYTAPSGGGTDNSLGITSATVGQIAKITAVDAAGKPTGWGPVDMPSGGTYTLPIASPTVLGGVKPIAKTDAMAQGVGVDEAGALWTAALGGSDWEIIAHIDVAADAANNVTEWLYSNLPRYKYIAYKKINLKGSTETASGCLITINGENTQPSGLSYAKSTGVANGHGLIYVMPFGWGHVATTDSNSPNNHAGGGLYAMYNTFELTDNAITSIKLSAHTIYKIESGDIWLYGKK